MNTPVLIRQPLAVRLIVAPVLRLALAVSLLMCLAGFSMLHLFRKITRHGATARPPKTHPTRKRPMHMGNAIAALKLAQELADECGAKPFLISGTLLGIHRNGALLAHDNDLDIGIFADDPALGALVERLRAAPQVVHFAEKRLGRVGRITNPWIPQLRDDVILYKINIRCLPDAPPVQLDLFIHFRTCGQLVHGSTRTLWMNSDLELTRLPLDGISFWAPTDRALYLEENYGNFTVPKIDFESSVDCPNCLNILTFPACATLAKKWTMFRSRNDSTREKMMNRRILQFITTCLGLGGLKPFKLMIENAS